MSGRIVNVRPKQGFLMDGAGEIIPARQNVAQFHQDRLTNIRSGMGTTADKSVFNRYAFIPIEPVQAEASYRSSWLVRKIVDVPALDMTRAWRDWQADNDTISKLEAEERRLQLKDKCKRALILSRLYGGGALLLGTNDADPSQPLNPSTVKAGGLRYVHVFSRHQLALGPQRLDPADPYFGKPEYFQINVNPAQPEIRIHPSRIVEFIGQRCPEGSWMSSNTPDSWFWGDPIMQSVGHAVQNADTAQSGFAALIDRAAVDVFKFKNLMSVVGTPEGEKQITNRVAWTSQAKSTYRAALIDADDDLVTTQINWAGMPLMLDSYLLIVAGAADIPMTRLLGQSPKGLQSTGDGEERDYQSMIKARQDEQLVPALDRIDQLLIPSALGSQRTVKIGKKPKTPAENQTSPDDIYYAMGPLQEATEKDAALMEFQYAQGLELRVGTGILHEEALAEIEKNRMIESGRYPGAEAAFEEFANEPLPNEDPANGTDPHQLTTLEQKIATLTGTGKPTKDEAPEAPAIHVTVPVEVHMPKSGGTRTVVTKHTKDGRIEAFEQRPVDEEE